MRWFRHPRRALDAYFDTELERRATRRVEVHLAECARCRNHLETMRRVRRSLRSMAARAGS
ncbi:zf-HC2 domain-containing protein [Rhabdothermincola salaria]|uniref:zf-HC2 domain-containing protein n=1 Tax=Rhabdothermincola salaria TaxID=2903142 RepID=UPI003D2CDF1F